VVLAGCVQSTSDAATDGPLVDTLVAGDTTVLFATRAVHPNGGTLAPDLTIGLTDGPEPYLFGLIRAIAVDAEGSIYVADAQAHRVRQYDASGTHVRDIGAQGEGPGEFRRGPTGLGVTSDGRVIAGEPFRGPIHVFASDGTFLASWNMPPGLVLGEDGDLVHVRGGVGDTSVVFAVAPDGTLVDTIRAPLEDNERGSHVRIDYSVAGFGPTWFYIPYAPVMRWAWSPLGYMVTGAMDRYAIDLRLAPRWQAGNPVVSIRRDFAPVPIPDALRDEIHDGVREYIASMSNVARVAAFEIPEVMPPYDWIETGHDGRIWLRVPVESVRVGPGERERAPWAEGWFEARGYDLFEPDGRYLGRVPLPDRDVAVSLMQMRGDTAWARSANADGAPIVVRYVIRWR
jgi:hypothetical protein